MQIAIIPYGQENRSLFALHFSDKLAETGLHQRTEHERHGQLFSMNHFSGLCICFFPEVYSFIDPIGRPVSFQTFHHIPCRHLCHPQSRLN